MLRLLQVFYYMRWINNMEKIYLGRIVSTHGIKGELKIKSSFPYKEKAFRVGNQVLIDDKSYEIKSYRVHKQFDMVTLDDYHDINEVLFLLKKKVYIDKEELLLDDNEVLDEELMTFQVLTTSGKKGIIKEIFLASPTNKIMRVQLDKEILVPLNSPLVKIDTKKKEILIDQMLEM